MANSRRGFTLTELLVVITIIGLLSSIATVSFTSSRMKARDGRRLADMDTIRKGLEIYNIDNGGYPPDNAPGPNGIVLGKAGANRLTAIGWTSGQGAPLVDSVNANPLGGGVEYIYYSLNKDGTDCDFGLCGDYRVEFELESNIVNLVAGPYVMNASGARIAPPEIGAKILARSTTNSVGSVANSLDPALRAIESARQATIGNPTVQNVAQDIVAPVSTAAVAVSAVSGLSSVSSVSTVASTAFSAAAGAGSAAGTAGATVSAAQSAVTATATGATALSAFGQVGALFYLLVTQPFLLLRKKKEYAWGVVYDSQKKLPIDLAIVRLVDNATNRVVQTRVTDRAGRIFFFAPKGSYRMEATKPGFSFPSRLLAGERQDNQFTNLYFGQKFAVPDAGQVVNPSIPLDPAGAEGSDKDFIKRFVRGKVQHGVSLAGFILTIAAFTAKPNLFVAGLLALNLILYGVFRRILYPKQPTEWGTVKDEKTSRPIAHAVVRLFSSPYNKLVETRVADRKGRYNFLVGQNIYYLTATSQGYWKTESYPIDLRTSDKPQIISAPVRMRPLSETASPDSVIPDRDPGSNSSPSP